ncbi:hypothetical protein L484_001720 [Morus notabilis]|uniref:Cyclin-dependent protein kinase inhibitor SMR1 n=1 Tax=Morus notabilis TaxID=981085 RepID=W9S397_9ROSA|nr:cyclin-dependent protein kinase inhibitor SMR1 [Morus notabilis]EXC11979.1 hypothetical protein L484_001720 [Morus notabilis]
MSTDLEFCQALPKIRLSPIQIQTPEPSESKTEAARSIIQRLDNDRRNSCDNIKNEDIIYEEKEEINNECRTPTSAEHRIPAILSCPPAPRKPATARAPSCKRKLSELDFFDVVNREEIDRFFRSSFAKAATGSAKRSCCPCK